jgi:hypothetical protein
MGGILLDDIACDLSPEAVMAKLRVEAGSPEAVEVEPFARAAATVARPKAFYRIAYVEDRGDETVVVDGVTLTSRVLRVNLEEAHRVFVYVATCGVELDEWANAVDDPLHRYWTEGIKEMAVRSARQTINRDLADRYRPGRTSHMSPGSLADWPIREQRGVFALLGDSADAVGVRLTDSLLMVPNKSVSGISFPTEESFESCQLCPREDCPGRRAPYEPDLYERKYGMDSA